MLSLAIAIGAAMTVMAVHNEGFELDADTEHDSLVDWDDLFDANFPAQGAEAIDPPPTGFDHATFAVDFKLNTNGSFNNGDDTTYATGSKDTLPINLPSGGDWQCGASNNVTDKDDIMNAYAVAFERADGADFLYFGIERNANNGDANVGFWFLQDEVNCVGSDFTGNHKDGDVFIVSAFSNGGDVSTIDVYRWNIPNPLVDPIGSLGTTPIASGRDCRDPLLDPNDSACAVSNQSGITTQWLTAKKTPGGGGVDQALDTSEFFEGGLNLTATGLAGKCFNTFIANTRSSTSLTATIFDFTGGRLGECTSTTVTTPSITTQMIPVNAQLSVTDSALVTVDGIDIWEGDVTFHLCGPFAMGSSTLCSTGGVFAGTKPVSNGAATAVSNSMIVTSVGRYCWRANFVADEGLGVPPSNDSRASECFTVTPRQSLLTTQAVASTVNFGQAVGDNATLSGTAMAPSFDGPTGSTDGSINPLTPPSAAGGIITFTLKKADCTTNATGTGTNPQVVNVTNDGTYPTPPAAVTFTPDAPGTYHWIAVYTPPATNPNTLGDSHNAGPVPAACSDPNEQVVVSQIPTQIRTQQRWFPQDTAEIKADTGNLAAGGTVKFELHLGVTCSGSALYSREFTLVGGANTETFTTDNTTVSINTGYNDTAGSIKGPYSWLVVYTPAASDTAHTGRKSGCSAENFSITYTNDPGPGSLP